MIGFFFIVIFLRVRKLVIRLRYLLILFWGKWVLKEIEVNLILVKDNVVVGLYVFFGVMGMLRYEYRLRNRCNCL